MTLQHIESRNRRIEARKQHHDGAAISVIVVTALAMIIGLLLFTLMGESKPQPIKEQTTPVTEQELKDAVESGAVREGN